MFFYTSDTSTEGSETECAYVGCYVVFVEIYTGGSSTT